MSDEQLTYGDAPDEISKRLAAARAEGWRLALDAASRSLVMQRTSPLSLYYTDEKLRTLRDQGPPE